MSKLLDDALFAILEAALFLEKHAWTANRVQLVAKADELRSEIARLERNAETEKVSQ